MPDPIARSVPAAESACVHHWIVASLPTAGAYPAACRRCGAERRFPCQSDWFDFNDAIGTLGLVFGKEPADAGAAGRDEVRLWAEALDGALRAG